MLDDGPDCRQHPVEGFLFIGQLTPQRFLGRDDDREVSARNTALRVCFPAFGRNPVSARLSCFIGFISSAGTMTMALFSQIRPYDIYLCRVSLGNQRRDRLFKMPGTGAKATGFKVDAPQVHSALAPHLFSQQQRLADRRHRIRVLTLNRILV